MKKYFLLLIISFLSSTGLAQEFRISKVELAGDKLHIHYNLIDTVTDRTYNINVYSSKDNYIDPLQKLSGDVGLNVTPGLNKKISWNAKEELGADFEGSVGLEIRGRLYIPFVRLSGFEDYKARKRGVPFAVTWSGGTRQNVLNFDLYNNSQQLVWTQPGLGNTGSAEITIPTNVKPGGGYHFKIRDSKNKDQVVSTREFYIKRKVPLLLKTVPTVALVGGIFLLTREPAGPKEIPNANCPEGDNSCNE